MTRHFHSGSHRQLAPLAALRSSEQVGDGPLDKRIKGIIVDLSLLQDSEPSGVFVPRATHVGQVERRERGVSDFDGAQGAQEQDGVDQRTQDIRQLRQLSLQRTHIKNHGHGRREKGKRMAS